MSFVAVASSVAVAVAGNEETENDNAGYQGVYGAVDPWTPGDGCLVFWVGAQGLYLWGWLSGAHEYSGDACVFVIISSGCLQQTQAAAGFCKTAGKRLVAQIPYQPLAVVCVTAVEHLLRNF